MSLETPYLWIQTRDASPTLWSNALGESFRSVKGAFTESWSAFVAPALGYAQECKHPVTVGEFGLGPGTNWVLWSLASASNDYFVIERDPSSFELGQAQWAQQIPLLTDFLRKQGLEVSEAMLKHRLATAASPRIYSSLSDAQSAGERADLWFHDPFGYDVNPEAYKAETLTLCRNLWKEQGLGTSYACNRYFKRTLEQLPGVDCSVLPTGGQGLKRERLEFRWKKE